MIRITSRRALLAFALLVPVALDSCAGSGRDLRRSGPSSFADRSLSEWCALLEPEPDSRAWQTIPWRTNFHAGLAAAAEAQRPLLLWLMNGHPLGCT